MDEVVREDEWYTLPLDAELGLEVAQNVAEVYVEELADQKANQWAQWSEEKTQWESG